MSSLVRARLLNYIYGMPVIFKYDFNWGSCGAETSLWLMPSMDLMYFSIVIRLLGVGMLLVMMINPSAESCMNSVQRVDLNPFK